MKVSELMNYDVRVLHPRDTLRSAALVLRAQGTDMAAVAENGKLVGSLLKDDVISFGQEHGLASGSHLVSEVMNVSPASCTPELDITDAEKHITEGLRSLIVVDSTGMILGTLSVPSLCTEVQRQRGPITGSIHTEPMADFADDRVQYQSEESFPASDSPTAWASSKENHDPR